MEPLIRHAGYCGTTRYGKSECCVARVAPQLLPATRPSLWGFDPAGALAERLGVYLRQHRVPFVYDQLHETSNVPGYPFCSTSRNPDQEQREAENRETIANVISVLVRAEGKLDATRSPMILRALTDALLLLLYQLLLVPFYMLRDCFVGESPTAQFLLGNCTDPDIVRRFQFYHSLRGQQRDFHVGAAERRLMEACSCVQFRKRCQSTFDIVAFINAGGIALIAGSSKGNLSRADMALLMGMMILLIISLARSGRLTRKVIIVIDEGLSAGLIDLNVARALAEAAKWGVEFHLIFQNPLSFPHPEIREQIFQNCSRLYLFRQVNIDAAMLAGRLCGVSTYDPLKIKDVIIRLRQEHAGIEIKRIINEGTSKDERGNKRTSENTGHISVPIYRPVEDRQEIRFTAEEQVILWAQKFRNFRVGECVIQEGEVILESHGPLPLLKLPARANLPFSLSPRLLLGEREFQMYVAGLKATPMYATPAPFVIPWQTQRQRRSGME